MSKTSPPKPETGEEFVLGTINAEKRRQAAARAEGLIPNENADLLDLWTDLDSVHDLVDAAYMAAQYFHDGSCALTTLLDITSAKLKSAIDDLSKIMEARS